MHKKDGNNVLEMGGRWVSSDRVEKADTEACRKKSQYTKAVCMPRTPAMLTKKPQKTDGRSEQ